VETTVTDITVLEGRREGRKRDGDRIRDWVMSEIVHRREGKGEEGRKEEKRREGSRFILSF
jgi:hypothetical protein